MFNDYGLCISKIHHSNIPKGKNKGISPDTKDQEPHFHFVATWYK